jgi:hypothetical protein
VKNGVLGNRAQGIERKQVSALSSYLGSAELGVGGRVHVINVGLLQFQLREFDMQEGRFTGHVRLFEFLGFPVSCNWSVEV